MRKIFAVMFAAAFVLCSGASYADTASVNMTTDNHYQLYLSDNESTLGTFIGQSNQWVSGDGVPPTQPYDWQYKESFTFSLIPGKTNYLQILAVDNGGSYAGVLGDFSLSNSNYWFDNGTQSLLTGVDSYNSWNVYRDNFGVNAMTLKDLGLHGVTPWGTISGISGDAHWIWTDETISGELVDTTRYFTAKINTVPEPVSTILFVAGGAVLAVRRLRRKA